MITQELIARENYQNSLRLLNAETRNFKAGGSSLFLVNLREMQAIESQIAWFSLKAEYQRTLAKFYFDAGLPISF